MQVSSSLGRGCSVQPSFMILYEWSLSPSLGMQHHTVGVATSNLISAALYLNANRVHQVSGLESLYWKHVTISGVHCSAKWSPSFRPSANDVRSWKRRGYPTQMKRALFDLIQMGGEGGQVPKNLTDVICTSLLRLRFVADSTRMEHAACGRFDKNKVKRKGISQS